MIELKSTDTSIKPLVTEDMTLRCSLRDTASVSGGIIGRKKRDNSDSQTHISDSSDSSLNTGDHQTLTPRRDSITNSTIDVDFVIEMVIYKDDQDIASVSEHIPAQPIINSPDFSVTGSLSGQPGERGFLQLTWRHPTGSDDGVYRCEVEAVSLAGHKFSFSTSLKIDKAEVTFEDVVQTMQRMEREKDKMADQLQNNEKEKQQMNATINTLSHRDQQNQIQWQNMNSTINTLTSNIQSLNSKVNSLQQANNDLTAKVNKLDIQVFFSAGLTTTGTSGHD